MEVTILDKIKEDFNNIYQLNKKAFLYDLNLQLSATEDVEEFVDKVNFFLTKELENAENENSEPEPSDEIDLTLYFKNSSPFAFESAVSATKTKYPIICLDFIDTIIKLDEALRFSKFYNIYETNAFVGEDVLKEVDLNKLNVWGCSKVFAMDFSKGSILKTLLSKNFPYISGSLLYTNNSGKSIINKENKLLLPPCEFEVESYKGSSYYDPEAIVKLKPLSLAKEFLSRMKNPPANYPKEYIANHEYQDSLKKLEDYVENYVNKRKILLTCKQDELVIDELNDSENDLTYQEEEK